MQSVLSSGEREISPRGQTRSDQLTERVGIHLVDIAGEASWVMNMQEMSTCMQYRLPVKSFILNNSYMGMVRQWQTLES